MENLEKFLNYVRRGSKPNILSWLSQYGKKAYRDHQIRQICQRAKYEKCSLNITIEKELTVPEVLDVIVIADGESVR